ncbi:hypothetical protein DPMN_099296 [Dreissena polymorpha]|uniref:Uncharacterized protein n=1 Tax=Dreissena polymorpha TaxID=45954 RepID=A0A9D4LDV7_DREPO|nr:hypothetical protein DPMN_099296 [Dreissena polymorpha]
MLINYQWFDQQFGENSAWLMARKAPQAQLVPVFLEDGMARTWYFASMVHTVSEAP